MDDREVMAVQIGRPLRSPADVAVRCHLGLPVVSRVAPILDDGSPFPTRYWLTCPLAARRIGRIESAGGVAAMDRRVAGGGEFAERHAAAAQRYATARDALVPVDAEHRPSGGVGGAVGGVKCLHAHYADYAAGNDNPVGEATAPWVEPLDCVAPCVADGRDGPERNPAWREPA